MCGVVETLHWRGVLGVGQQGAGALLGMQLLRESLGCWSYKSGVLMCHAMLEAGVVGRQTMWNEASVRFSTRVTRRARE